MRERKKSLELSMSEAGEQISLFFHGDQALIQVFKAICLHILELDGDLVFRTNGEVIGICKPGERYRFFVSIEADEYFIKYKDRAESEKLLPSRLETYLAYNASCIAFFAKDPVPPAPKRRAAPDRAPRASSAARYACGRPTPAVAEEWLPILAKAQNGLRSANDLSSAPKGSDEVYHEIVALLTDACSDRSCMAERDGDIIANRILDPSAVPLRKLGEKYDISGERIRQRERNAWKRLTIGIYLGSRESFLPYRERLRHILMDISDEVFISTIVQICRRNAAIGSWLQRIVGGADEDSDVSSAIKRAVYPSAARSASSTRGSADITDRIRDAIDIVAYVSARQMVTLKDEVCQADCPFCGVNDALIIYPETKSFRCLSCMTEGDVITYLMKTQGMDHDAAVSELASSVPIDMLAAAEPAELPEVMRKAALYYHAQLKKAPGASVAIDILHAWGVRGSAIVRLGLGFHDHSFITFMEYMTKRQPYSVADLEAAKLVTRSVEGNYCDTMRDSIIIPTIDANGRVVCFDSYRTDKRRLFAYPDTKSFTRSQNLYAYNLAVRANKKSVIIVTTYADYFKLMEMGITNAVSTYLPEVTEAQLDLLKRSFKAVILLTDQDTLAASCARYCRENDMYYDRLDPQGCSSVVAYIEKNAKAIHDKVDEYERVLA